MATISVLPSRKLVYVDLNVWERAGSGDTSTNKSIVEYSVVIRKGSVSWNTSWAGWNKSIYATYAIDGLGTKTVYIPTYNYGGTCPPGTVIASGSFEVEHDSLGNKTIGFSLSFTDNADGNNDGSYYTPGDASTVYGSVDLANIPRYFSSTPSMTFKDKTETQIRYDWSTSETCDNISISGSGTKSITGLPGTSGVITITGLSANTSYTHTGTFRRSDSQLTSNGPARTNSTYNYPHITSAPNFTIGNTLTIELYNPLGRSCAVHLINPVGTDLGEDITAGTRISGYTGTNVQNFLYAGIPNSQSGKYRVRLVCNALSRDTTVDGGTYYIKGTEIPTFNESDIINVIDTLHVNDITGLNTKIIKGHNAITGTIKPMVGNNYAGGKRYIISANANPSSQEITHTGSNKSFTFSNITTNTFTVTAYDTRELSTARTKNIDLVDYSIPKVNNFTITRQNGLGTYAVLAANGTNTYWSGWSQIKKYNTIQKVYFRYKPTGGSYSSWIDITAGLTKNANGSWTVNTTLDIVFDTTTKYDFQLYVQDLLESSSVASNSLSTANGFLWRDLLHKWLGINKKPTCTLDVNGDIKGNRFYGCLQGQLQTMDNRNTNEIPDYYMGPSHNFGLTNEFKQNGVLGTKLSNNFCNLLTVVPWADDSGGLPVQVALDTSGFNYRMAASTEAWGSWYNFGLLAYPVGSIYMSVNPTNPQNLFGGTWVQLKNAFLFATNSTSGTKGTGSGTGTKTGSGGATSTGSTVLGVEHIPSHTHKVYDGTYGADRQVEISGFNDGAGGIIPSTRGIAGGASNSGRLYAGPTGGGQGHSHSMSTHTHTIPYLEVYVWKRTA